MSMKELPLRKCVVCGQMKSKDSLFRVVKVKDGDIFYDSSYKANGRGAYICKSKDCLDLVQKKRALNRAFKGFVDYKVIDSLYEEL